MDVVVNGDTLLVVAVFLQTSAMPAASVFQSIF